MTNLNKTQQKKAVKKATPYPNEKTLWSYYMQAIEPESKQINEAFPEYHPMWVQQSQKWKPSGVQFKYLREFVLKISQQQCAAYFRVPLRQIKKWELEIEPIPFIAFELLRVVFESKDFKLSHPEWAGWYIHNGRLVCPDVGKLSFAPSDLSGVYMTRQLVRTYHSEYVRMKAAFDPLKEENKALKDYIHLNELDAVLATMAEIRSSVTDLFSRINTSSIKNLIKEPKSQRLATADNN